MKKRCPWCGEEIDKKVPFGRYHCQSCGNYSNTYRVGGVYMFIYALVFIALIVIDHFVAIHLRAWMILIIYFGISIFLPLEMDSRHFVPRKSAEVSVKLLRKYGFFHRKFKFSEKQMFVICFVDENDMPVSHMLCISTEDVKFISADSFESNIKFIPLSENNTSFAMGTKFYIFEDKEKIAVGELRSDVG